jgi:electron-transferring-flavoprotein dehydrogenase
MTERESMEVDVVIVGGGVAGLSAAIRLQQLAGESGKELSIVVLEKAAELGAHVLSGAVIDPIGLQTLFPDWKEKGAPLKTEVLSDSFTLLNASGGFSFPNFLLPPLFSNHGNYIASLGELTQWLGAEAETMGIDIFPGFAATELLLNDDGSIKGVATGDMGIGKDGEPKPAHEPGMELHARYTLLAEGARGSLSKQAIAKFGLDKNADPQHFGLGVKEVWEVDPKNHEPGHVEHTLGWPLDDKTSGGGFIYHTENNQVLLGFVTHLNYSNPHISPFNEMQKWKTHPKLKALLSGGKRIAYGARAMTSGGWQSIPELAFPGGALIGCAAGFMNLPRIKGSHNAMLSGIKTAEAVFEALTADRGNDLIEGLNEKVTQGEIKKDLFRVRNAKALLKNGTMLGTMLTGFDLWTNSLFGFSLFGTLHNPTPDHATLKPANECEKPDYPKPDGELTFDRTSSVFLANLGHDEDQPVHLKLKDPSIPVEQNLPVYDEPAQRYCPAAVYEIVTGDNGQPCFQINAANCVHCKTCDIKDPAQNIDWVPPEGGSGPNYQGM